MNPSSRIAEREGGERVMRGEGGMGGVVRLCARCGDEEAYRRVRGVGRG